MKHPWPVGSCLARAGRAPHAQPGPLFLRRAKQGTLSFVYIKVATTVVYLAARRHSAYRSAPVPTSVEFSPAHVYLYVGLANNAAVSVALYALVLFYVAVHRHPLLVATDFRPLAKFMCIKGVVFFTYWQLMLLHVLKWLHLVISDDTTATQLQNFLVCVEMFVASVAHAYCFSYRDFVADGFGPGELRPGMQGGGGHGHGGVGGGFGARTPGRNGTGNVIQAGGGANGGADGGTRRPRNEIIDRLRQVLDPKPFMEDTKNTFLDGFDGYAAKELQDTERSGMLLGIDGDLGEDDDGDWT